MAEQEQRKEEQQQAQTPAPEPGGLLPADELEDLMHLPLSRIKELPTQTQEKVWASIGQQAVESEQFVQNIVALRLWQTQVMPRVKEFLAEINEAEADGELKAVLTRLRALTQALQPRLEELKETIGAAYYMPAGVLEQLDEAEAEIAKRWETWQKLKPYIRAEADEHPELYGKDAETPATLSALMAAAARRARADGQDIPPLREEEPQQLEMDLPGMGKPAEEQTPAEIVEQLKRLPVLKPAAHIMPNNPLMNMLQNSGAINGGEFNLVVAQERGKRKEITAFVMADLDPGETDITITDPKITEYERQVSNAIISLWTEAEKQGVEPAFTPDSIYRAMPGGGETASPQQRGAIVRAVEKLRRIHMTIDATEELRKRGAIGETETFKVDEFYFQMTRAKRTPKHGAQPITAYRLTDMPVMLKYARMTRQILSVPARHLQIMKVKGGKATTELIAMNTERTALTGYMLRRIAIMKHDLTAAREKLRQYDRRRKREPALELPQKALADFKGKRDTILFDTMFAETGIDTADRKQTMLYRNFCLEVLEYWKCTGFIADYATKKSGRKITGISISLER